MNYCSDIYTKEIYCLETTKNIFYLILTEKKEKKTFVLTEGPIINLLIRREYGLQWSNSPTTLNKNSKYSIPKKSSEIISVYNYFIAVWLLKWIYVYVYIRRKNVWIS